VGALTLAGPAAYAVGAGELDATAWAVWMLCTLYYSSSGIRSGGHTRPRILRASHTDAATSQGRGCPRNSAGGLVHCVSCRVVAHVTLLMMGCSYSLRSRCMQETAGTRGRCHRKPAAAHCARKLAAAADLIGSLCGRLRTEWNARGWFGHEVCDGGLPECLLDLAHGIIQPAMKRAELSSV